jgi:hypothetical protein
MKLNILLVASLFTISILVTPKGVEAYFTSSQTATDLGNGNALFTVTYRFGFLNRDVYMPVLASRNKAHTDKGDNLGYSILVDGKTEAQTKTEKATTTQANITLNYSVLPGKAKAMVLADAQIKDGRYFLPKGKAADFTLVALVEMSKTGIRNDLSLLITSLPFLMIDNGKSIDARLNPSELQYYVTPEVDLKK